MTRIAILLLAVLALGLAACGGGDDDGGDATPGTGAGTGSSAEALPKDEFIERGDQICKDLQKKAQALGMDFLKMLAFQPDWDSSAWLAEFDRRVSTTARRMPRSFADMIRCACGLK